MCNFDLVIRFKLLIWILTSSFNIDIPFWMSVSIASYLILFLLFHITHRVILNKTLMNSVPLLILKYPAILSVNVMAKPLSMWFLIIHSVTFQIVSRPLHVVSICSTFSTTFEQTLHDPSEYCILQSRFSVLIWPWNSFQLKSLHFLGIRLLHRFCLNHVSHAISSPCNLFSQ